MESCGTVITFDNAVLFDYNMSDIRPDAAAALDYVAEVFITAGVPTAVVEGHTDSHSSLEYNQGLSERRAAAVVDALRERGVTTALTAEGYGKTRPIAPNEIDGEDNPAGRQLNRRVEIFIPSM